MTFLVSIYENLLKMKNRFDAIEDEYRRAFEEHGFSPSSVLTPKGRSHLRYRVLDSLVHEDVSILDYGCGLGFLYEYLARMGVRFEYTGVDFVPEFIEDCRKRHDQENAKFKLISPSQPLEGSYDIVFASGVFNLASHESSNDSRKYASDRIRELFLLCDNVFVCDFLSAFVDFEQEGAQHFSFDEIASLSVKNLSRRFYIRHDLLPYEFTLVAFRDGEIVKPENIYKADR